MLNSKRLQAAGGFPSVKNKIGAGDASLIRPAPIRSIGLIPAAAIRSIRVKIGAFSPVVVLTVLTVRYPLLASAAMR